MSNLDPYKPRSMQSGEADPINDVLLENRLKAEGGKFRLAPIGD